VLRLINNYLLFVKLKDSKVRKTLNILFRLLIVVLSLSFIYWKLFAQGDYEELLRAFTSFRREAHFIPAIIITLILMFFNWGIEAVKWQMLVSRVEEIGFIKSVQSVISGVTVSIFTPNRTGEFIGRAFILKKGSPGQAVILTLVGSFSQLLVTLLTGSLALAFTFTQYLPGPISIPAWSHAGIVLTCALLIVAGGFTFFRIPVLLRVFETMFLKHLKKLHYYLNAIYSISRKELLRLFLLSVIRYLVFSLQFFLVLKAFDIPISIRAAISLIPVIFLTLAAIPTVALSELGVRGSVSLFFIGQYLLHSRGVPMNEQESLGVVLAAGLLWVINLAIPAIAGIPFVFRLKFFRR
jgi:hypothetical protein